LPENNYLQNNQDNPWTNPAERLRCYLRRERQITHRAKDYMKIVSIEILSPKTVIEITMATNLKNYYVDLQFVLV